MEMNRCTIAGCTEDAIRVLENVAWPSDRARDSENDGYYDGFVAVRPIPQETIAFDNGFFCNDGVDNFCKHERLSRSLYHALLRHQCMYDCSLLEKHNYYYCYDHLLSKRIPDDVEKMACLHTLVSHLGDLNRGVGGGMISRPVDAGRHNLLHCACMTLPFKVDIPDAGVVRALLDACVDDAERSATVNAKSRDGHTPFTLLMASLGECEDDDDHHRSKQDLYEQREQNLADTLNALLRWTDAANKNAHFEFPCHCETVPILWERYDAKNSGTALDAAYVMGYPSAVSALLHAGTDWTDGFRKATEYQGGSRNCERSAGVTLDALLDPAVPAPTRSDIRKQVLWFILQNVNSS